MKLKTVQAKMFRNILDSTPVSIDSGVTAIVGKNESGKTSFLIALSRLHAARGVGEFQINADYPAWLEKKHRHEGKDLGAVKPIEAVFQVEDSDRGVWAEKLGAGVVACDTITSSRSYGGKWHVDGWNANEPAAVAHVLKQSALTKENAPTAHAASTFAQLKDAIEKLKGAGDAAATANVAALEKALTDYLGSKTFRDVVVAAVAARVPKMFYFANYSSFPKQIKIRALLQRARANEAMSDDERTAVSLLRLAATDDDYLLNGDYELRKRELENVANAITDDVLQYWTQNPDLRVLIDITQVTEQSAQNQQTVLDELKLRVWDDRHRLSLGFSGRSSGFQWFFSFLSAFSEFDASKEPMIILLDEPALGLHARAQADFLRFIDERLAPKHQVIYTTHSPFMVPPGRLERVRVVEDGGRDKGSRISSDVLATDPDTLFPLQGALGYDLVQHLFVAPNNLVVEGTSDFTYLTVLSEHLVSIGRIGLDPRWSIVPVGGADLVPTFVALLGHHLDVTVLVDSQRAGHQKLNRLATEGLLEKCRVLTVGGVLGRALADIEDAFEVDDYLTIYNAAFGAALTPASLVGTDPIVARIARHLGVERFDHGRPGEHLLRNRTSILPTLKPTTLDAFERLFKAVNATLPPTT